MPLRRAILLVFTLLAVFASPLRAQDDGQSARFEKGLAAADASNYKAALEAWLPLAEEGYEAAAYNVAILYRNGWGTKVDPGEALIWFWAAASQGNIDAAYNLATMYERGEGLTQPSPVEAWAWFSLAAQEGHKEAAKARDAVGSGLAVEDLTQAHRLALVLSRRFFGAQ